MSYVVAKQASDKNYTSIRRRSYRRECRLGLSGEQKQTRHLTCPFLNFFEEKGFESRILAFGRQGAKFSRLIFRQNCRNVLVWLHIAKFLNATTLMVLMTQHPRLNV